MMHFHVKAGPKTYKKNPVNYQITYVNKFSLSIVALIEKMKIRPGSKFSIFREEPLGLLHKTFSTIHLFYI
jgi:hypothetical protein